MTGRLFIIQIFLALFIFSCKSSTRKTTEYVFPELDSVPISEAEKASPEALEDIARNISSPVEIANILQKMAVPYSASYLASSIDANRQNTNFNKALKLGILGADLGYLNMYEKTSTAFDLLSSIKKLADGIYVGQYFDFEAIKRLSRNRSNLDSLMYISQNSFNQIDKYLRANDRGQYSSLMIIGVWIEGQYFATKVLSQHPDTLLRNRVGEQAVIIGDLLMLLAPYKDTNEEYKALWKDMQALREKYLKVTVRYTQGDPIIKEKNGVVTIEQTEQSIVEITNEQLAEIVAFSARLRDKLISNN
jgi:hypothetical protein